MAKLQSKIQLQPGALQAIFGTQQSQNLLGVLSVWLSVVNLYSITIGSAGINTWQVILKQLDERRLAENEVIFKQINEDVGDFLHDIGVQHVVAAPFYCECSNIHCTQRIELSGAEYKSIHRNPKRFIVINGHENHDIEKTVERRVTYSIVEKMKDLPTSDEVAHRLKELK